MTDKKIEEEIRSYYEPRIKKYDKNFEILDWEDPVSHEKRFVVLAEAVDLEGKKLLDVACGLGDLYGFLQQKGISVEYTGVDLLQKMVTEARKRYPRGRFLEGNLFARSMFAPGSFDIAFSSGIFNLNLGNNRSFLREAVRDLLALANEAVVFNCLNRSSPNPDERYFYFSPEEIRKLLSDFPIAVTIISGYLGNDITVVCRPAH